MATVSWQIHKLQGMTNILVYNIQCSTLVTTPPSTEPWKSPYYYGVSGMGLTMNCQNQKLYWTTYIMYVFCSQIDTIITTYIPDKKKETHHYDFPIKISF